MRLTLVSLALVLPLTSTVWAASPSRPGALRAEVYSDTAAELFWARSTDDGRIRGYEIQINGEIATVRDGSSYFTDTLVKGVPYDFLVTAIDDEENRSAPASVSIVGGDQGSSGGGTDGPPTPGNLRSATYSPTAIELFWDRVPGVTLTYEISIDGAVVANTRGVSYFTDALERGQRYAFGVVATDASGNRSAAVTIVADTAGRPISIPPAGPATPSNVSIIVYSRTAAELFWDRAPAEENVVSTEIRRNGDVIGMAEGNSFFDDTRDPDSRYTYGLTAIDKQGNRSITTELAEAPSTTIINQDNYIGMLTDALAAFSGENYVAPLNGAVERVYGLLSEAFPGTESESPTFPTTYACSNGGTAFFEDAVLDMQFTDCQIDEFVLDGNLAIFPSNATTVSGGGLLITTNPDTTLLLDGNVTVPGNPFFRTFDVNAQVTSPIGTLSLAAVNTQFSFTHLLRCCVGGPDFVAEFMGSFDFSSSATDGELISAATTTRFFYEEPLTSHTNDWNYRGGVLQLLAEDDSEVVLDAATGDDATVSIRLSSEAGTEQFIQPWSLWQSVLRRAP